jgi:hypothetical protein
MGRWQTTCLALMALCATATPSSYANDMMKTTIQQLLDTTSGVGSPAIAKFSVRRCEHADLLDAREGDDLSVPHHLNGFEFLGRSAIFHPAFLHPA